MSERLQNQDNFGDSQVQALFDKFLAAPDSVLGTGDILTKRVLAEVQVVYGAGAYTPSPIQRWIRELTEWLASFRPRAVVIAFGSVAVAALFIFAAAVYMAMPRPVSIAASVPTGEVLVLKPNDDTFRIYKAGETFSLAEGDQIIARTGSVQLEPFPQQFADVMPGAQVELAVLENEDGSRRVELYVIDGQMRHRGFEPLPAGDRYFVSTASLRAEVDSNDFEVNVVSPTRSIITARDGSATITGATGNSELMAGQAAEVGERAMLIYEVAPLQEGPGEIAMAEPQTQTTQDSTLAGAEEVPSVQATPGAPQATLSVLPIPPADSTAPVTGASGGFITSTAADGDSSLTVSNISFDDSKTEPVLSLTGYGPSGTSVQVLVQNRPIVTATVGVDGQWMASTPVTTIGRFDVDVVAVNNAGAVVATASAAQMEVGPPQAVPTPTPAEQSGLIPPVGPTATRKPVKTATPTKTPIKRPSNAATATTAPILLVAPVMPPTATPSPTSTARATATPKPDGNPPFIVLPPSPTPTSTPTAAATPKPAATATTLPTSSATPQPSATQTGTATATDTPSATSLPTGTATSTATKTPLPIASPTSTIAAPTATVATPTATSTSNGSTGATPPPATDTPTVSIFPSPTPSVPTATATQIVVPTATPTAVSPSATPTSVPPTATSTSVPPTSTPSSILNDPGTNQSVPSTPATTSPVILLPLPTPLPPTAVPPTAVPPTAVAPTAVPPTAVAPTAVAPTAVAPTAVPPTTAPTTAPTVAAQPAATATSPAVSPSSPSGNTTVSDATPAPTVSAPIATQPPPAAVPPTAVPATAAPTLAAAPASVVSQPAADTVTSDSAAAAAADSAPPPTDVPAAVATEAPAITAPPAATDQPVNSVPAPADTAPPSAG